MSAEHFQREVTTAANGSVTVKIGPVSGRLVSIKYTKHGTTPFDNTATFAITSLRTGQTLWSEANVAATKQIAPRQATHSNAGAAALYASGGEAQRDYFMVVKEFIQIAITSAGAAKIGQFDVVVDTE